jgi:acyl-coenzyme A synthetase/AMP-(fatty) acid ligase
MNITNTIWQNCHAYSNRIAILHNGNAVSYGALRFRSELASSRLAAAGVAKGDVVALSVNNVPAYLVLLLSVARLGAAAIPLGGALSQTQREEIVSRHRVHTVVLDKEGGPENTGLATSRILNVGSLLVSPADGKLPDAPPVVQDLDEQPWFIAVSSGTTGTPKSNPQTHIRGTLLCSISPRAAQGDEERVLVFASLGIEYGLTAVMRQLYRGATTVLAQPRNPNNFFATVQRDRPTRVVTTTGTASALAAHAVRNMPDSFTVCAGIRSIMVAGSIVSPSLRKDITERICSMLEVDYGSTETGSLALSTPETHAVYPASAGRLNPWVQAEAVDENDQPLPIGKQGVLRFKSLLLTKGYLGDDQATARAFRNGWFYPGDTGIVSGAGYLFLGGRTDHMLNLGGIKIDPRLIEKLLDDQPEIAESVVVAVDRGIGITALVAVVEARAPFDPAALQRLCMERLGKRYAPHVILQVEALPRNESGKVMRSALAARIKMFKEDSMTLSADDDTLTDDGQDS